MQRTYGAPGDPGNRAGRGESLNWTFRTGVRLQRVAGFCRRGAVSGELRQWTRAPEASGVIETERVWVTRGALEGWHTLAHFGTVSAVHANAA